jgi:CRISPR-associated protein Cas8b/Csh1 subtype I-B
MRGVREDFWSAGSWQNLVARIFRTLLFFDFLVGSTGESNNMVVDYGQSPQAARVRELLRNAHGKLKDDPAAQAAFLIGACCGRIETIQAKDRGLRALSSNAPFSGKLKGFNLNERDVRILFREAKSKAAAYGEEAERTVGELLKCAAAAFFASPEPWDLSPDEVSYFVALGHTLKSRLAEKTEVDSSSSA